LEGEVTRIPYICVITGNSYNPDPEYQRSSNVKDGPRGNEQWRSNIRNLAPCRITNCQSDSGMVEKMSLTIEGNRQQTHARAHSENLIDYFVVRLNPAREAEVTERREDKVREPIPTERYAACHSEESIARHLPSIITVDY
jgi:hypothetical protein